MEKEVTEIPKDVEVIKMPRLSDTMEEGTVATWLKKVGDDVEEGDILAEIETDKATMEFESFYSGNLLYIGIKEGESAPVDDVLRSLAQKEPMLRLFSIKNPAELRKKSRKERNLKAMTYKLRKQKKWLQRSCRFSGRKADLCFSFGQENGRG